MPRDQGAVLHGDFSKTTVKNLVCSSPFECSRAITYPNISLVKWLLRAVIIYTTNIAVLF